MNNFTERTWFLPTVQDFTSHEDLCEVSPRKQQGEGSADNLPDYGGMRQRNALEKKGFSIGTPGGE